MRLPSLLPLAAALGLALSAASPAHADVYEASFDGAWFNATQGGRGALVDYIPRPSNGTGQYFIAVYTYDTNGNALWLTLQADGREGQRIFRNVEVRRFAGGSPGNTFTPPSPATGTVVGTAVVDFANCGSLKIDYTPNAAANGLPAVNFNYVRLDGQAKAQGCPFTSTFSACPTGTTAVAGEERTCEIPAGTLTGDVVLPNSASYVIGGRVAVGGALAASGQVAANTGTLTIQPGTILRGKTGSLARLIINPGSKIFAEGSALAPIVMTGPTETGPAEQGSWGGLILAGRAPINANCTGPGSVTCAFEADTGVVGGGSDPSDNSGVLKYLQVRSAGAVVTPPDKDLNAITFLGVGNGTTVSHVQAHNGSDDGFEWFGGTVNADHLIATGNDDDAIDTDFGFVGKLQYVYVKNDAGSVADSQGLEADNGPSGSNFDASPRSRPQLVNATLDGSGLATDGARLRRGTGYILQNVVITGYATCINLNDSATYLSGAPAGQPTQLSGNLTISGALVNCPKNFDDVAADPWLVSAWFNGQTNNATSTNLLLDGGRFPQAGSPARSGAVAPTGGEFFERSQVKGAFADGDWSDGWTVGLD